MDVEGGNRSLESKSGVSFPFPFTPYDVQLQFMQNLYTVLQEGKTGIFESPTGTGKSLSIICGALTWLRDFNLSRMKEMEEQLKVEQNNKESDVDDWFSSFARKKEEEEKLHNVKIKHDFLVRREERIKALKKQLRKQDGHVIKNEDMFNELFPTTKRLRKTLDDKEDELSDLLRSFKDTESNDDLELVLENYESDEEGKTSIEKEEEENHVVKIFYASRTHSQLSQFVGELQRSPFHDCVSVTVLGSRQNMCINQTVNKLKSLSLMNERCLELQKGRSSKSEKSSKVSCPFYKQANLKQMQDNILVTVKDIEQIVEVGKQLKACPYYSTRHSITEVEVVVLPYNTLLHKQTRDACGINLKDSIVIIDEAHNLLEAINNIHSAEISGSCLHQAYCQLHQYQQRYYSRLNPKNLLYIKQLLYSLSCLVKYMGGSVNSISTEKQSFVCEVKMMHHNDFLSAAGVANINLFKIVRFCEESQIGRKLHGFSDKYQVLLKKNVSEDSKPKKSSISQFLDQVLTSKSNTTKSEVKSEETQAESANDQSDFIASPFTVFVEFLRALTYPSNDGRVLVNKQENLQKSSLKFLLLNPAAQFKSIVTETRSVIVAGGTMQPFSEFTDQLFIPAGLNQEKIMCFSCDHVIPPGNLLAVSLSHGPSGNLLDFTYQKRNLPEVISELGRILINLTAVIPGGMVCFFPSYDYEQLVYSAWEKTGVIARLENRKKVFREPRKSSQVDKVLSLFSKCISLSSGANKSQVNGALLLSIVGGKMSEGINFSNELGRCVVMVGLPYPNVNSPELKEKMDYLNRTVTSSCGGKSAGQVYYENLCMKAVNQSIGRAIRHKGDYATIVLVDSRYTRASVKEALPQWIATRLFSYPKFGQAFSAIRQFFVEKKNCL